MASLSGLGRASLTLVAVIGSCALPEAVKIEGAAGAGGSLGGNGAKAGASSDAGQPGEGGSPANGGSSSGGEAGSPSEGGGGVGGAEGGTTSEGGSSVGGGGASGGEGGSPGGSGGGGATGICTVAGTWPDSTPHCSDSLPVPCPFATEDGSIEIVPSSYTTDAGHVTDNLTGLQWEQDATQAGETWSAAAGYCAGLSLDGLNDWRLPTLLELTSIIDYGLAPAIGSEFSQEQDFFWTSSPHPASGAHSGVNFSSGLVGAWDDNFPGSTNVRCVHGSFTPGILQGQGGVVVDTVTLMEWRVNASPSTLAWGAAINYCESLGNCWRLPTAKELLTIFDPAVDPHLPAPFPGTEPVGRYWTSTPDVGNGSQAWFVDFSADAVLEASANVEHRSTTYRARCVRGPTTPE